MLGKKELRDGLILIAPIPSIRTSTRLTKIADRFNSQAQMELWGWKRTTDDDASPDKSSVNTKYILHGGGYSSKLTRVYYLRWSLSVFLSVLLSARHRRIYCYGLEAAFPAVLASKLTQNQVVFDDPDRTSLLWNIPAPIRHIIEQIEDFTAKNSTLHLIPGYSRYKKRRSNMFVLPNVPNLEDVELAHAMDIERPEAQLVVYVNGWLAEQRGATMLLNASQILGARPDVQFICAGRPVSQSAKDFITQPNVTYVGEVPQCDALALYKIADLACTFYDPRLPINRYAEPNKWWDCVAMGTPPLVNTGLHTSKPLEEAGACITTPYNDDGIALADLLSGLAENKSRIVEAKRNIALLRGEMKSQEELLDSISKFFV